MTKKIGITGSGGYIGSNLVAYLNNQGYEVKALKKDEVPDNHLQAIVYCAGKTGDYLTSPLETIEAHVNYFAKLLNSASFDHIIYLSSVRVYDYSKDKLITTSSSAAVSPYEDRNLFDLTKITGEWLAVHHPKATVVRIASVFGGDGLGTTFLQNLLERVKEIRNRGLELASRPDLARYYIPMNLLCRSLETLACSPVREKIYDVMVSSPISNTEIANIFAQVGLNISFKTPAGNAFLQQKIIQPTSPDYLFERSTFDIELKKELQGRL